MIAVSAVWGVFWGVWGGLLPAVQERIGGTLADLGLALVAVPVGAIPAMVFTGRLARGRERALLGAGLAGFALAIALLALPESPAGLGLALALVGMTSGALDVCLNMTVARAERTTGRRLFQPVHAAFPVAVVISAPLAGVARQAGAGPAAILVVTAVVVLVVGGAAVLRLRLGDEPPVVGAATGPTSRSRWIIGIGILGAGLLIVENGVEQWSAVLLEDFRDAGPVIAASGPAAYYLALTAGRLIAQARPSAGLRLVMALGAAGGGAGIALAALVPSAPAALIFFAVTGLAFGPVIPAMLSRAAAVGGSAVARVTTISYAGFVASPLLVSLLHRWLDLPAALACLGLLTVPLLAAATAGRPLTPPRD